MYTFTSDTSWSSKVVCQGMLLLHAHVILICQATEDLSPGVQEGFLPRDQVLCDLIYFFDCVLRSYHPAIAAGTVPSALLPDPKSLPPRLCPSAAVSNTQQMSTGRSVQSSPPLLPAPSRNTLLLPLFPHPPFQGVLTSKNPRSTSIMIRLHSYRDSSIRGFWTGLMQMEKPSIDLH